MNEDANGCERFVNVTEDLDVEKIDYAKLSNNLWTYIRNYNPGGAKARYNAAILMKLMKQILEVLKKDPMVVKVAGPSVIFGPLHGEGDSMITLMSQSKKMPPEVTYVMLGCYIGRGFAQLECLVFLFSMKILFPSKVVLLKGHHEESIAMELLKVKDWLTFRGISQEVQLEEIIVDMKKACNAMSAGAVLNGKILCMPGGPGPVLRERGLKQLMSLKKGMQTVADKKMMMEAAWSVLILNEAQKDMHGMPSFTAQEAADFCKKHNLKCIIRGRQMVDDGFLNKPKEVITLFSAVAYLDNFRNHAAAMIVDKDKGTVIRYKMEEGEQHSLELVKPGMGRNAVEGN
ncbi:unnamed protein product [Caenorhabditis sp. 36 PRJEB53466]|nr:unnamed protein product [Caenorhabditis sp. 36 PRJEB53466]